MASAAACDEPCEEVDLVVAVHALEHGGEALEAHARVYRRSRQWGKCPVRPAVVLHEDQVPDLHVAVPVLLGRTGGAAGDLGAVVVEDLGAGTAGSGVAHGPEVVLGAAAGKACRVDPYLIQPDGGGLVVIGEDRHPQPLRGQGEGPGQIVPGVVDGLALEVVAEAEVAQHLEEGVMAGGIANVFEVVVLAARAHAALGARGPGIGAALAAEEDLLELDHPRVGEEQGRVVGRHQRAGGHPLVTALGEIVEEARSDVGTGDHGFRYSVRPGSNHAWRDRWRRMSAAGKPRCSRKRPRLA